MNFFSKINCRLIFSLENFFSEEKINSILSLKKENTISSIFSNSQLEIEKNIRSSYTSWVNIRELPEISNDLDLIVDEINNTHWRFKISNLIEASIVSYLNVNDNYDWHIDWYSNPDSCNRKITVIVQLSDENEYDGCELEIKDGNNSFFFSKKKGSIIVFPSFLLHRATKLISGKREALVLWYYGDSFT